jgi:uncharacterized protein
MPGFPAALNRRRMLRALGLLGGLALLPGCSADFADARLRLATGPPEGGYFALGTALATVWQRELELGTRPEVRSTTGSLDNLQLLAAGAADVAFCRLDVAADQRSCCSPDDPAAPRALARIYDDVVHVVATASSAIRTTTGLRGTRVSVGDPGSGAYFIAERLLAAAGLLPQRDLRAVQLGIGESATALAAGEIDAFVWSGALPSPGISMLATRLPIRLLDLSDVVAPMRSSHAEYTVGTVPAGSYGIPQPVTCLSVRNVLLVGSTLADDLAAALVKALLTAQDELALASRTALAIDPRTAIGTQPLLLHPGAERFYRSENTD